MKKSPVFFIICFLGVLGWLLRLWLFGAMDAFGLVPEFHIASVLLLLLTAAVLVILSLLAHSCARVSSYRRFFPGRIFGALGSAAGAAGILLSALPRDMTLLSLIQCFTGVCAAVCMGAVAYCRLVRKKPDMLLFTAVTIYTLFHLIDQSRVWNCTPQMQQYLPPMLAHLFLMLTAYYQAELAVHAKHAGRFLFCNGAALFFCLISMNTGIFFLLMALWCASEVISFREG